jgi:hypothetical protein
MRLLANNRMSRAGNAARRSLAGAMTLLALGAAAVNPGAPSGPGGSWSLPVAFEANHGQAAAPFRFIANGRGCAFLLAPDEAVIALARSEAGRSFFAERRGNPDLMTTTAIRTVGLHLAGANPRASSTGLEALPGRVNYFLGSDPAAWHAGVPMFAKARFREVYPGVDVVYYGHDRQLEFDFIVAPGADAAPLAFEITGADEVRVEANGDLVMKLGGEALRQHKPVAYQTVDGVRVAVESRYRLAGTARVELQLGRYDRARPLVIDPVFSYATYFGGSVDERAWDIAVDKVSGEAYIAGETTSAQLAGAVQAAGTNGVYGGGTTAGGDAFVAKLNSNGTSVVWLTYLGGNSHDGALGVAVDAAGCAYVTGFTGSTNFPTVGALGTNIHGNPITTTNIHGDVIAFWGYPLDGFVTKLDTNGTLSASGAYSAFLGGDGVDEGIGIAVDSTGAAYVTGLTESTNLPTTNALQASFGGTQDAFVAKVRPDGSAFEYLTYLGGTNTDRGDGIAVDGAGYAYVTGFTTSSNFWSTNVVLGIAAVQPQINIASNTVTTNIVLFADAFVVKLYPDGSLFYSTFLGGSNGDYGFRIATDAAGNAYVTGSTYSGDFPVSTTNLSGAVWTNQAGANVFATKVAPDGGSNWLYSVSFGGSGDDRGWDLAVSPLGDLTIVGATTSTNFPVLTNTVPAGGSTTNNGAQDAFIAGLTADGSALAYSFYYGGQGSDLAYGVKLDSLGNLYIAGETSSTNLFVRNALQPAFGGGTSDAFVAKLVVPQLLSIARSGRAVRVQWPALAPDFALEARSNPDSGDWLPVTNTPAFAGGRYSVTLDATNAATRFRLRAR